MNNLRFPIGKYVSNKKATANDLTHWIKTIENFPTSLNKAVACLTESQLNKTYRVGGWTVKQLVHHLADSHMSAFMRFKLALTEDNPTIKDYSESEWAKLHDYNGSIESSLKIIDGMHARWTYLLNEMTEKDFDKTFFHPEFNRKFDLMEVTCQYDWHCRHHLAHIKLAI